MQVEVLGDAAAARAYYDARYRDGYMDRWDAERHARLREVLLAIDLPPKPRILDYGCGSGALTELLAERWPDALVSGADVSATAIASARRRRGDRRMRFDALDAQFVREHTAAFDFVFSHHVLEHVFDLDGAIADLVSMLAPGGRMLHALPCGNAGSLSHWLCRQRRGGIDPAAGNRFHFEEASHLRRLRSDELAGHFAGAGVRLEAARFACHWLGEVRMFTELSPLALGLLLSPRGWSPSRWPLWLPIAACLTVLWALRAPMQVLARARRLLHQARSLRSRRLTEPRAVLLLLLLIPALCLLPLSWPVEAWMQRGDRRQWRSRARDPRAAEMLLQFAGPAASAAPTAPPPALAQEGRGNLVGPRT